MAIHVGKTLGELEKMARLLNISIPTEEGKKPKKEQYIMPIREYMLEHMYHGNVPQHLQLMLNLKSPMLAGRIDKFKQDVQDKVWNDDNWIMEQKLNGIRCIIAYDNVDKKVHLYSRHNSDETLLPIEFTDKILFTQPQLSYSFIADCELTSENPHICTILDSYGVDTQTQLQAVTAIINSLDGRAIAIQRENNLLLTFNIFDVLYYQDQWIMEQSLSDRLPITTQLINDLSNNGFNAQEVLREYTDKKKFFKSLLALGLEGTVAKRLDGPYIADTSRNKDGWIKCKRSLSGALVSYSSEPVSANDIHSIMDDISADLDSISFGDTIDAFITGFTAGTKGSNFEQYIGSISVSCYIIKDNGEQYEKEIAKISGLPLELRKEMTEIVNGKPRLKAEYYGKVLELDGQSITKNGKFAHAVMIGWKYDKLKDDCTLEESFIQSQVL